MSIASVAELAGVSTATVSRMINNHPSVSPETAERVRVAMEELGYVPAPPEERMRYSPKQNVWARTGNIALLIPDVSDNALRTALSGRLMHGVEAALREYGLNMMVTRLTESDKVPPSINPRQVDGVVLRNSFDAFAFAEGIKGMPVVNVFEPDHITHPIDGVQEDNKAIGAMAAEWLLGRGHRNLAFLNMRPGHPSFAPRGLAFENYAKAQGANVRMLVCDKTHDDAAGAEKLVSRLLSEKTDGLGLFLPGTDVEIVLLYRALCERGVNVEEDVDIIGCFNDLRLPGVLNPRLANMDINAEEIGRQAVEMLVERLKNPRAIHRRIAVPPRLVEGKD